MVRYLRGQVFFIEGKCLAASFLEDNCNGSVKSTHRVSAQ